MGRARVQGTKGLGLVTALGERQELPANTVIEGVGPKLAEGILEGVWSHPGLGVVLKCPITVYVFLFSFLY